MMQNWRTLRAAVPTERTAALAKYARSDWQTMELDANSHAALDAHRQWYIFLMSAPKGRAK